MPTLEFVSKKHVNFDQGVHVLIFYKGKRGKIVEKRKQVKDPNLLFVVFFSIVFLSYTTGKPKNTVLQVPPERKI